MGKKIRIAVIGGGLAGLYFVDSFAKYAAKADVANYELSLFEKKRNFGDHIRCAQGASLRWFKKYIPNYEKYISNKISTCEIYSVSDLVGTLSKEGEGAIINRKLLEYDLGQTAHKKSSVYLATYVKDVVREGSEFSVITNKSKHKADIVVACDGVESKVLKSLALFSHYHLDDIDISEFYVIEDPSIKGDKIKFYFGKEIAPGGYLWVFPERNARANVGIGINAKLSKEFKCSHFLDPYIAREYPNGKKISHHYGAIPTPPNALPTVGDAVISVGDAGFGVNPFTRAGIIEALSMANIAAEELVNAIIANNFSAKYLKKHYAQRWKKLKGRYYPYLHTMKIMTKDLSHTELMIYKSILDSIPENKRTMWVFLKKLLFKNPLMLWKMRKFWI